MSTLLKQCQDNYSNSSEFNFEKVKVTDAILKASAAGLHKCHISNVKFGERLKEFLQQEGFVVEYDRILSSLYVEGWDMSKDKNIIEKYLGGLGADD
jgi:hypothetical protein